LVADGELVLDVPARLSARVRALGGGSGRKTDGADAYAVAVAGRRARDLQVVRPDDSNEILRLLSTRRQEVAALRITTVNRLHDTLCHLISGGAQRHLSATKARQLLSAVRPRDAVGKARKQLALDYAGELDRLDGRLKQLKRQIGEVLAEDPTSLVQIDGIATINAAKILAEVGDVHRFASRHHFASYTGTAPIDVSSERTTATGSTAAATDASTTPCTSPPSCNPGCPDPVRTTTGESAQPARPTTKPCAALSDASPTPSIDTSPTTWQQGTREDTWGRLLNPARLP
jgi:transposase